jgi:hypothetical protein
VFLILTHSCRRQARAHIGNSYVADLARSSALISAISEQRHLMSSHSGSFAQWYDQSQWASSCRATGQSGSWVMSSSWRRLHTSPRTRRGTGGSANGYAQRLAVLVSQR